MYYTLLQYVIHAKILARITIHEWPPRIVIHDTPELDRITFSVAVNVFWLQMYYKPWIIFVSLQRIQILMVMENKKLVSVRIDADDLREIDRICNQVSWRKRSDVIQLGVKSIIAIEKMGLYPHVQRYCPQFGDVIDEIKFEYHRKPR